MADNSTRNRGVKRKRLEEPTDANIGAKISGKLHHDLKEVRKAAKKAKAFETQKLAKRLKSLRKKDEGENEIKEMETQLEILKRTGHEPIANTALKTKLNKDRLLSENIHLQAAISTELATNLLVPATTGTSEAKIQSRLLSSKIIATQVSVAIEDLRAVIEPVDDEDSPVDIPGRHKKAKGVTYMKVSDGNDGEGEDVGELEEGDRVITEDEEGWESGTVGSEHEEDRWESGSQNAQEMLKSDSEDDDDDDDGDGDQRRTAAKVVDDSTKAKQHKSTVVKTTPKLTGSTSTFLPSLSVGFIRGDSEGSEWSDDAKSVENNQKKNRRGQRARRAIWEKKYGRNANHRKAGHEATAVNRGRSGAGGSTKSRATGRNAIPQHSHSGETVTQAQPTQPLRKGEEQRLHPSWEAKRKLKEKQNAGIIPAQGTKIKF